MVGSYITRGNTHAFWHAELTCSYMPARTRRAAAKEREREKEEKSKGGEEHGKQMSKVERNVKKVDSGYLAEEKGKKQNSNDDDDEPSAGDKRKKSATPEISALHKAPKVEESSKLEQSKPTTTAPTTPDHQKATPVQCLKFLLSDAALPFCRPADETSALDSSTTPLTSYSQLLTPFEELLCAVILSRPISHRLGRRTILTILNAPYEFRNPVAIKTGGSAKVRQALDAAHTQHKGKTTEEISLIADAVTSNEWHNDLSRLRKLSTRSVETEREILRRSIKGLGKTGLDIFYRRVQWLWDEAFPFVDPRTLASLEKLGFPRRPEGIVKMIEVRWSEIGWRDEDKYSVEERQRRAFVMLLERVVGADLEKRIEEVLVEAAKV